MVWQTLRSRGGRVGIERRRAGQDTAAIRLWWRNLPCGMMGRASLREVAADSLGLHPPPCHCHCSLHAWGSQESPWILPSLPPYFLAVSNPSYSCLSPCPSLPWLTQTPLCLPAMPCGLCYLRPTLSQYALLPQWETGLYPQNDRHLLNTAVMALSLPTLQPLPLPSRRMATLSPSTLWYSLSEGPQGR